MESPRIMRKNADAVSAGMKAKGSIAGVRIVVDTDGCAVCGAILGQPSIPTTPRDYLCQTAPKAAIANASIDLS